MRSARLWIGRYAGGKALAAMALDGLADEARPYSVRICDGTGEIMAQLDLAFRAEFYSSRYPDLMQ